MTKKKTKTKAFAKEATLISGDANGTKTYEVKWVDKNGVEHIDHPKGNDMASALSTVLRTKTLTDLTQLPAWVWVLSYSIFIGVYTVAAFTLNSPLLVTLGLFLMVLSVKLITDRYFRYVG